MATTPYPFVSGATLTASQLNSTFNIPLSAQTANYVLLAADAGKRVQMNNASATTITVNTSLFSAGDSVWIQNIGAGTTTVTSGTCTVTTAGSLAVAQYGGGELYFSSTSTAIFFPSGGKSVSKYITSFTSSGTYTPATGVTYAIAYLKGGGGGQGSSGASGGGNSSIGFASGTVVATGGSASNTGFGVMSGAPGVANSGLGARGDSFWTGAAYTSFGGAGGGDGAEIVAGGTVTPGVGISVTVGAGGTTSPASLNGGSGYVYIEWYQ